MAQTKSDWRRALLAARAAIPETTRRVASDAIARRVLALRGFVEAGSILGYVALGAEVDAATLLAAASAAEIRAYVPCADHSMEPPLWTEYGRCATAHEGVDEQALKYPVLAIVPGVGFDFSGTRLGRGSGFYDRALATLREGGRVQVVGLAFECQIVPVLPYDSWDQGVDIVVSERRVVTPSRSGNRRKEAHAQ
jgi:5-formyltetrahydrofolate cyclo-ligase